MRMTFAEYAEREGRTDVRHEWHAGAVVARGGGTIDHSRICRNVVAELARHLDGKPCEAFESNLRLYVHDFERGYYPDAQVICGPVEYLPTDSTRTTVVNRTVVIEVLSPSMAEYDRGEKLRAYLSVLTLKQYVLIESTTAYAEVLTRRDDGWLRTDAAGLEATLKLASIDVELKLSEIYLGVEFPSPATKVV